jgi:adenine-specific DNA-methyltransferase
LKTHYHAKSWAETLMLARPQEDASGLTRSLANARVDLQPHQIDAALFALRSPFSKGVLLADEVGLGKTIEASLVLSQKWAERRRRILLIVPATLRKQWQGELSEKFFLPTQILETRTASLLRKGGKQNPFDLGDRVVIASYQFVYSNQESVRDVPWDLVVVDEAHRLRNVYKNSGAKLIQGIVEAIRPAKKLLLTATPLQNSLLELYGLVGILDDQIFGGPDAFAERYVAQGDADTYAQLRQRLEPVCKRTLRKQVAHFIPFTNRRTFTADFIPSPAEEQLYDLVSEYLQRPDLAALPNTQRKLITMVLRKLLASSSAAIGATLAKLAKRLRDALPEEEAESAVADDFEGLDEIADEWAADAAAPAPPEPPKVDVAGEVADLERFVALAGSIARDAKADALLGALKQAFDGAVRLGARRKAVVFTESVRTQQRLFELLSQNGYEGEVVLLNGTNNRAGGSCHSVTVLRVGRAERPSTPRCCRASSRAPSSAAAATPAR